MRGSMRMGHSLYGLHEDSLKAADPTIVFTQGNVNAAVPLHDAHTLICRLECASKVLRGPFAHC